MAKAAASLKDSLSGIKQVQSGVPAKEAVNGKRLAKTKDAEYIGLKVYVRKDLRKDATRRWEDENPDKADVSDLVEHLLREYLGQKNPKLVKS